MLRVVHLKVASVVVVALVPGSSTSILLSSQLLVDLGGACEVLPGGTDSTCMAFSLTGDNARELGGVPSGAVECCGASMVGEPILKPWANPEGQMIQQLKRMRDEQGHCAKD